MTDDDDNVRDISKEQAIKLVKPKRRKKTKLQEFMETVPDDQKVTRSESESDAISLHNIQPGMTSASEISLSEVETTDVDEGTASEKEVKALSDTEINTERNKIIPHVPDKKVKFSTRSNSLEPMPISNKVESTEATFGTLTDKLELSENEREDKYLPHHIPVPTQTHAHIHHAPVTFQPYVPLPTRLNSSQRKSRKRHRNPHKQYRKLRDYEPSVLYTENKFGPPTIFGEIDLQEIFKSIGEISERDVFHSFRGDASEALVEDVSGYESTDSTQSFNELLRKVHLLKVKKENEEMLRDFEVRPTPKNKRISFGKTEEVKISPLPVKTKPKPKPKARFKPEKSRKVDAENVSIRKVLSFDKEEESSEKNSVKSTKSLSKTDKNKKKKKQKQKNKEKKAKKEKRGKPKKKKKKKKEKKKSISSGFEAQVDTKLEEMSNSGFIDTSNLVDNKSNRSSESSGFIMLGDRTHATKDDMKRTSADRIEARLLELNKLATEEEALEAEQENAGNIDGSQADDIEVDGEGLEEEEGPEPMIGIQYDPERQITLGDPIKVGTTCYAVDFQNGKKFRKCKVVDFTSPATYTVKFGMFRKQPGTQRLDIVLKQPKNKGGTGFGLNWLFKSTKDVFKASISGDTQAVLDNILKNADVVEREGGPENKTPLYYAAKDGHEELVKLLLRYGAEDDEEGSVLKNADSSVQKILTDFGFGRVGRNT